MSYNVSYIINGLFQAFTLNADSGQWSLDTSKPYFMEEVKRVKSFEVSNKQHGKPREIWECKLGGASFRSLYCAVHTCSVIAL